MIFKNILKFFSYYVNLFYLLNHKIEKCLFFYKYKLNKLHYIY